MKSKIVIKVKCLRGADWEATITTDDPNDTVVRRESGMSARGAVGNVVIKNGHHYGIEIINNDEDKI